MPPLLLTAMVLPWFLMFMLAFSAAGVWLVTRSCEERDNESGICDTCEECIPVWRTLLSVHTDRSNGLEDMGKLGMNLTLRLLLLGPVWFIVGLATYYCDCRQAPTPEDR